MIQFSKLGKPLCCRCRRLATYRRFFYNEWLARRSYTYYCSRCIYLACQPEQIEKLQEGKRYAD